MLDLLVRRLFVASERTCIFPFLFTCHGQIIQVLLTIIQPDDVVSAIHSFVKDRKEARLLDQVTEYVDHRSVVDTWAVAGLESGDARNRKTVVRSCIPHARKP